MAPLHADLVFLNAKLVTLDSGQHVHSAMAVWQGRILAVGSDAEIEELVGPATKRIDLGGRTAVPGLIDSHCHPDSHAIKLEKWANIGWPEVGSVGEMLAMVERANASLPPETWFQGFGYNDQKCGGYPTRAQLDAVAPTRPVWLYRTDGHIAVVNTALLRAFGVDEDTLDPPHGHYLRDPDSGLMTGVLCESAAWNLDARLKEEYQIDDYRRGLRKVFPQYLRHGITSLHNSLTHQKAIAAYQQLRADGELAMRVGIILDGRDEALVDSWLAAGARTGFGDDWIRLVGVEWCPDCSTSGRTAAYYDPYVGTPVPGEPQPNYGMLLYDADELVPKVIRAHKAGLRVCVEGIGDRGIDFALDAIEAALTAHPSTDHRSRVEHCCHVTPAVLERLKRLGVIDSSATGFMYSLGDAYIENRGVEAMDDMWPHRRLIDADVRAAGHSDAPICGTNPWEVIASMVMRTTDTGQDIGTSQAVTPLEALRAYTTEGAYIGFEETIKGTLEPGKLADVAVLDRDVLNVSPEEISDTRVDLTVLNGEVVYER